jgi:adenine-specific DNA-methyltransferase
MKYMGSKRSMLRGQLGTILATELKEGSRFHDLFSGSAAVSAYVAERFEVKVFSYDLQSFSVALANATLLRTEPLDFFKVWTGWLARATRVAALRRPPEIQKVTPSFVASARRWCARQNGVICRAYGGHYFSPKQAIWIDALRKTLPVRKPERYACLAALIQAASQCAAAPGHTAQPFQPTRSALPFLSESWTRDVVEKTNSALQEICCHQAKRIGLASRVDANKAATRLRKGDIAFIDPPYSGVHYSRFYHVLETISRGQCGPVSGVGRYPSQVSRPRSDYSMRGTAATALDDLFRKISSRKANAILTFPEHECSNGLSGSIIRELAAKHFRVTEHILYSRFSTMGGTGRASKNKQAQRAARHHRNELLLILKTRC